MAVRPTSLAQPASAAPRPFSLRALLEREGVFSWLMLTPGVLFLLAFVAYPFFYGIFLSLEERRVASAGTFVGLAIVSDGTYALLAGTLGQWLRGNARFLRLQRYVSGGVLVSLGLATAFSGSNRK